MSGEEIPGAVRGRPGAGAAAASAAASGERSSMAVEEEEMPHAVHEEESAAQGGGNEEDGDVDDEVGVGDGDDEEADDDHVDVSSADEEEEVFASAVDNRTMFEDRFAIRCGGLFLSQAAAMLRRASRPDCPQWFDRLHVIFPPYDDDRAHQLLYREHFRDFVNELERYRAPVREIYLKRGRFWRDGWEEGAVAANDDLGAEVGPDIVPGGDGGRTTLRRETDRFFGTVLPCHASLSHITFNATKLELHFLQLLTESIANNPASALTKLHFEATPLSVEHARLLNNILRQNVQIRELRLWHCGLGSDGFRMVGEGAALSEHLEVLNVRDDELDVMPGTVVSAVGPNTQLKQLIVQAKSWLLDAFEELVEALRVNTTLVHAALGHRGGPFPYAPLVEDLLHTYNFSIQSVELNPPNGEAGPIGALLVRNRRVRFVHATVLEPNGYRVDDRALWPRVLQEFITFPTLLYRFARRGNVEALGDQVVTAASNGKKRRRDQR